MRKAKYDMRQVICSNASCIGYSSNVARPGYWIRVKHEPACPTVGRVLGRIAETDRGGMDCAGWLAVVTLHGSLRFAGIRWINPADVIECYEKPPADLLTWITGAEWVKNKDDIARIVAMSEHGTLSDEFIGNRDNPDQAYNARPAYVSQFILP